MKELVIVALVAAVIFWVGFVTGVCVVRKWPGAENTSTTKNTSLADDWINSRIGVDRVEKVIEWQRDEPRLKPCIAAAIEDGRITQGEYTAIMKQYLDVLHTDHVEELREEQ